MKHLFLINLILAISQVTNAGTYTYKCADPAYAMSPEAIVDVSFDKKSFLYTFKYKIENKADALVPIERFRLLTFTPVSDIKSYENWKFLGFQDNDLHWSSKSEGTYINMTYKEGVLDSPPGNAFDIHPGKLVEGFEFKSKYPPGPTKIVLRGTPLNKYGIVSSDGKFLKNADEILSDDAIEALESQIAYCPGYTDPKLDEGNPRHSGLVDVTIGPIPTNRQIAKLRIRKINEKKWRGSPESEPDIEVLPVDTGKIQVMLFGSQDLDVKKIDLASLTFGQGKAKPVKTVILTDFTDKNGETDNNIKEHIKKNNVQHLLMEFNLDDVDIRCDSERALFLDGKYGTKDLFGAVRIKHGSCMDKKNNAKELKKIRDYEARMKKEEEDRKQK